MIPADFPDSERHAAAVEYLNVRLRADGLVVQVYEGRVRCVAINQSAAVTGHLARRVSTFAFDTVQRDLERALASASSDPEDAVTAACSILESMCRSILIEMNLPLPEKRDLTTLYKAVREPLRLAADRDDLPPEISNDIRGVLGGLAKSCRMLAPSEPTREMRTDARKAFGELMAG